MQNFRALCLRRLGALPPNPQPPAAGGFAPDPHWPPAAGGSAPRPPKQPPPIANFWLRACSSPLRSFFENAKYFCLVIKNVVQGWPT